jgi:hypothetical protein
VRGYWMVPTRHGTFYIKPTRDRFVVLYEDENLGSYHSPEAALDDLVGGHTFLPSNGLDTSTVGLPSELPEWDFVRR